MKVSDFFFYVSALFGFVVLLMMIMAPSPFGSEVIAIQYGTLNYGIFLCSIVSALSSFVGGC